MTYDADAEDATAAPVAMVDSVAWTLRAARYRWADLLRRIFEVDPLACPRCWGPMRLIAMLTEPAVIGQILAHRARARAPSQRSRRPPRRRRRSPTTLAAPRVTAQLFVLR